MAMSSALKKKLAAAQKNWGKAKQRAETEKSGFEEIADGRYLARLTAAEIGESKSSSRLQVSWTYKILEGDYKGQNKMSFDGLETEDNLMYLARTFGKYGYEAPDDLEEVDALLTAIVKEKPMVKIRLKTKGGSDFQNLYIDEVYDKSDEAEILTEAAAEAAEEETEDAAAEEETTEEETTEDAVEEEAVEEETTEEVAEDEGEIEVGMQVVVEWKNENILGEVLEVLGDEEKVRVKLTDGKVIRVGVDKLSLPPAEDEAVEEEADEEEDVPEAPSAKAPAKKPAPAAAPAKKPAPAPAKKPGKK